MPALVGVPPSAWGGVRKDGHNTLTSGVKISRWGPWSRLKQELLWGWAPQADLWVQVPPLTWRNLVGDQLRSLLLLSLKENRSTVCNGPRARVTAIINTWHAAWLEVRSPGMPAASSNCIFLELYHRYQTLNTILSCDPSQPKPWQMALNLINNLFWPIKKSKRWSHNFTFVWFRINHHHYLPCCDHYDARLLHCSDYSMNFHFLWLVLCSRLHLFSLVERLLLRDYTVWIKLLSGTIWLCDLVNSTRIPAKFS